MYHTNVDNEIDVAAFLELTVDVLNQLIPNKLGLVKKIYRLIPLVSFLAHIL